MTISCQDGRKNREEGERPETKYKVLSFPICLSFHFSFFAPFPIELISHSMDADFTGLVLYYSSILLDQQKNV